MNIKLPTEHHVEFLSLKGGCRGCSESTLVKMPHCWKSHVMVQLLMLNNVTVNSFLLMSGRFPVSTGLTSDNQRIHRGSYMSTHVLVKVYKTNWEKDIKCKALSSILSLFRV